MRWQPRLPNSVSDKGIPCLDQNPPRSRSFFPSAFPDRSFLSACRNCRSNSRSWTASAWVVAVISTPRSEIPVRRSLTRRPVPFPLRWCPFLFPEFKLTLTALTIYRSIISQILYPLLRRDESNDSSKFHLSRFSFTLYISSSGF